MGSWEYKAVKVHTMTGMFNEQTLTQALNAEGKNQWELVRDRKERDGVACECPAHRYHVVHICQGKIYDHSQGTWDGVLRHALPEEVESYPSYVYRHGMTAAELREAARQIKTRPA